MDFQFTHSDHLISVHFRLCLLMFVHQLYSPKATFLLWQGTNTYKQLWWLVERQSMQLNNEAAWQYQTIGVATMKQRLTFYCSLPPHHHLLPSCIVNTIRHSIPSSSLTNAVTICLLHSLSTLFLTCHSYLLSTLFVMRYLLPLSMPFTICQKLDF